MWSATNIPGLWIYLEDLGDTAGHQIIAYRYVITETEL